MAPWARPAMNANDDFIECYDNALHPGACATLIERFEASGAAKPGRTGGGVNASVKNSLDITISGQPQWADAERQLNVTMLEALKHYLRKYPYAVLGPLWLKMKDETTGEM